MKRITTEFLQVALWSVLTLCMFVMSVPVSGQNRDRMTDSLALARICVSESSLPVLEEDVWVSQRRRATPWGRDCWAIHEVLLNGSARFGMRYTAFARQYSTRVFEGTHWVADLWSDAREPRNWPVHTAVSVGDRVMLRPHPPWSRYRASWRYALELAEQIVVNGLDTRSEWSVCESPVYHWGGAMDRARAQANRLPPVDCGATANDFYSSPSVVAE